MSIYEASATDHPQERCLKEIERHLKEIEHTVARVRERLAVNAAASDRQRLLSLLEAIGDQAGDALLVATELWSLARLEHTQPEGDQRG